MLVIFVLLLFWRWEDGLLQGMLRYFCKDQGTLILPRSSIPFKVCLNSNALVQDYPSDEWDKLKEDETAKEDVFERHELIEMCYIEKRVFTHHLD
jgi:hypothetical protein